MLTESNGPTFSNDTRQRYRPPLQKMTTATTSPKGKSLVKGNIKEDCPVEAKSNANFAGTPELSSDDIFEEDTSLDRSVTEQKYWEVQPRKPVPIYPLSFSSPTPNPLSSIFPMDVSSVSSESGTVRFPMSQYVGSVTGFPGLPLPKLSLASNGDTTEGLMQTPFLAPRLGTQENQSVFIPHFVFSPRHPMGKKYFRCPQCRYYTDRKNNLKRHIGTMHQACGKVLECCDIVFRSKAALRDHILLFHRTGYRCKHCGRNFCRKALLKRHLLIHNGQKEYFCDTCEYGTGTQANLDRHARAHVTKTAFESEEEVSPESNVGIMQATQQDQLNFWYLASGFRDPFTLLPYHRNGTMLPQNMSSLPNLKKEAKGHNVASPGIASSAGPTNDTDRHVYGQLANDDIYFKSKIDSNRDGVVDELAEQRLCGVQHNKRIFERPYKCSDCSMTFASQHSFREHAKLCKNTQDGEPQRPLCCPVTKPSFQAATEEQGDSLDDEKPLCLVKATDFSKVNSEQRSPPSTKLAEKITNTPPLPLSFSDRVTGQITPEYSNPFMNHYFPFSWPALGPSGLAPLYRSSTFTGFRPLGRPETVGSPALGAPPAGGGHSPAPRLASGDPDDPRPSPSQAGEAGNNLPLKKRLIQS